MKILHLSPTYFSERSFIGGGERYAWELAKTMSAHAEVVFLSYSDKPASHQEGNLRFEFVTKNPFSKMAASNPSSPGLWKWFGWADVIHCHQVFTAGTDAALLAGR